MFTSSFDASDGKLARFTLKNSSSRVPSKISPGLGSDSINFSRVTVFTPRNSMLPILRLLIDLNHHVDGLACLINLKLRTRGHIHVSLSRIDLCEILQS